VRRRVRRCRYIEFLRDTLFLEAGFATPHTVLLGVQLPPLPVRRRPRALVRIAGRRSGRARQGDPHDPRLRPAQSRPGRCGARVDDSDAARIPAHARVRVSDGTEVDACSAVKSPEDRTTPHDAHCITRERRWVEDRVHGAAHRTDLV
jgi:hypothetical protein